MTDRNLVAADLLDQWASALRADWGSIDGRQCRTELHYITAYLRGERETVTPEDVGLCLRGEFGVHWPGSGYGHNCYEEEAPA